MPILEQGYEPYGGTIRRGNLRLLSIARAALLRNRRWYVWVLLLLSLFAGNIKEIFLLFVVYVPATLFGADPSKIPPFFRALADHPRFYTDLMSTQVYWALVMGITVGAGELAEDLRTGGLVFYLGRPVTRRDYLLGKTLSVSAVIALVTIVPTLLLFTTQALFEGTWEWLRDHARVVPAAAAFTAVECLFVSGLVLGVTAIARRRLWATVSIAGILLGTWAVAAVFAPPITWTTERERNQAENALEKARTDEERAEIWKRYGDAFDDLGSPAKTASWRALSPTASLSAVARDLFGNDVPSNFRRGIHWWYVLGAPALLFGVLWRRIRAVEVVT